MVLITKLLNLNGTKTHALMICSQSIRWEYKSLFKPIGDDNVHMNNYECHYTDTITQRNESNGNISV